MSLTRLNVSLEGYEVGITGAVPEKSDWLEPATDRAILEFVSLLSSLVLKYGGRIVHGSHPALTPVIVRQARRHAQGRARKPVTLVISDLWASGFDDEIQSFSEIAELVVTKKIGEGGRDDPPTRNQSLTAMRRVLVDSQNVMVVVGGKMHQGDGLIPGIQEELDLAGEKGLPRFLIGGLGGLSRELASGIAPRSLANFLSEDQNLRLFSTLDIASSVNIIFEHLANSTELRTAAPQPIKWNPALRAIVDHRDGSVVSVTEYILASLVA
jgi:hypothetical protein